MYLKSVENVITLGKLIGVLFLFCLPLLSILFLKTKRNDLARPVMGSIAANFSEKLPVLFFFLLLSVSTTNLRCLLATTFSSLRFLFNFTSLQSFESGQRGFLFSHFRVLSSILSLSFLCSSVSEALFTLSFSFLSERFFFVHDKAALARSRNQ